MDFAKLEREVVEALHTVVADAEAHEPAIEDAVVEALGLAGAPGPVAASAGTLLKALLDHFKAQQPMTYTQAVAHPVNVVVGEPPAEEPAA